MESLLLYQNILSMSIAKHKILIVDDEPDIRELIEYNTLKKRVIR